MASLLIVNGYDLTKYLIEGGLGESRNDLDGPNAGRTMDGYNHRDYITFKRKYEAKWRSLKKEELAFIEHTVLRGRPYHDVWMEDFGIPMDATIQMTCSSHSGTIGTITGKRKGYACNFVEA